MSENRDCGTDAAAYVLGALEREEAEKFRAHMASCVVCRDEVSTFQAVADALPLAVPSQPLPPSLKRDVMAAVRAEPRASQTAGTVRRARRWPTWLVVIPRPALALGVLLLAVTVTLGAVQLGSAGSVPRVIQASVTLAPGSAELRINGGRGELIVRRLAPPPAGKIYEVWLKRRQGTPSPTNALFSPTANGSGAVDVPGDLHGVSTVMVTPEPLGGSAVPTHSAVIVARLT